MMWRKDSSGRWIGCPEYRARKVGAAHIDSNACPTRNIMDKLRQRDSSLRRKLSFEKGGCDALVLIRV
jgi:hypothetical protein